VHLGPRLWEQRQLGLSGLATLLPQSSMAKGPATQVERARWPTRWLPACWPGAHVDARPECAR
jgi:hypothetical protein